MTAITTERPGDTVATTRSQAHRVTQARVVVSEIIKLRSLRSSWITLLVAVVAMIGIGAIIAAATNAHWAEMHPGERATFSPADASLGGVYLAQLAIGVLGVLVITGEYATGMIRATFGAVPRRLPVLWAKCGVYAVVTFVLMLVASVVAFFVGQALLSPHSTTIGADGVLRVILGAALYLTVVGLLGVGLGFVIRNTAGGIASLFGLLLILPAIAQALPSSWRENITPYLPSPAGSSVFTMHPGSDSLAPWTGFGVFCAYAAAAIAIAALLLRRRDA